MTALPQRKITDEQDNPIVAALIAFVTDTLTRSLDDISNWSIIHKPELPTYAEFSVRFGDGSHGYEGYMAQGLDNIWRVRKFRTVMIVAGMHPSVSMDAHNQQ